MDIPAVRHLCMEQGDRSLKDHTRDFLEPRQLPGYITSDLTPRPEQSSLGMVLEGVSAAFLEWVPVEFEGLEGSPTHTPAAEGELQLVSGHYFEEPMDMFKEDLMDWVGVSAQRS